MWVLYVVIVLAGILAAQGWREARDQALSEAQIQEIIAKFAAKEAEFARARENYTYRPCFPQTPICLIN